MNELLNENMNKFYFSKSSIKIGTFFPLTHTHFISSLFFKMSNIILQSNKRSRTTGDDNDVIDLSDDERLIDLLRSKRIKICENMTEEELEEADDKARNIYATQYIMNWTEDDYDYNDNEDEELFDRDNYEVILRSFYKKNKIGTYDHLDPMKDLKEVIRCKMVMFEREIENGIAPEVAADGTQFGYALLAKYLKDERYFTSTKEGFKTRLLMMCGADDEEEDEDEDDAL